MCLSCALGPCIFNMPCKRLSFFEWVTIFFFLLCNSHKTLYSIALKNSLCSPLLAVLKSFVNNTPDAERWGHIGGTAEYIYLTEKEVESQQFFFFFFVQISWQHWWSEGKPPAGIRGEGVYHAPLGVEIVQGQIFTQIVFLMECTCFFCFFYNTCANYWRR